MGNIQSNTPGEYCDRLIRRRPELRDILAENVGDAGPNDYQRLIWREYMRQARHGSTHVHESYAAIDRNHPGLWRVWARMYLPFMAPYPDAMTYMLVQNCFRELEYTEHRGGRWDPNLKCKAIMSRLNFGSVVNHVRSAGQLVFISVLGVDGSNDNERVFQAPSGIWRHITSEGQSVWSLDPDQRRAPYWVLAWQNEDDDFDPGDLWKIGDVHGTIEERNWIQA